jgi:preprotein translocase subunit SecY
MLSTIASAFTVPEIRKKLAFTALVLGLYRLGSHIPVPGIDVAAVEQIQRQFGDGGILNLLNVFSGGGLSRIALFALGIMPYITASIILQLLVVVVPALEKLQKEGEVGQARITQYTRYLTVGLAFAQSIGYVFLFRSFAPSAGTPVIPDFDAPHVFLIVISLTAGTVLLMWMGELITQRGIGNGISLMIFASIVAGLPNGIQAWWTNPDQVFRVGMPFLGLAVIAAVVFIQEGQRRIPVQYAKRVIGRRMSSGGQTYLPLRVNMAGVIPVIFAASIMAFPPTIGQLVPSLSGLATFFNPGGWAYVLGETIDGGPDRYTNERGGYSNMLRHHLGKAITEQQRRRWVSLLMDAADEAGLPDDPEFRAAFAGYIEWGTRLARHNSQPGATPPPQAPVPHWGWGVAPPYQP